MIATGHDIGGPDMWLAAPTDPFHPDAAEFIASDRYGAGWIYGDFAARQPSVRAMGAIGLQASLYEQGLYM